MFKKFILLFLVLVVVALATIPAWSSYMAKKAFENHEDPRSPMVVQKAVKIKLATLSYKEGRVLCEKAVIYFPESKELAYFMYSAAVCAKKEGLPGVACYWYGRFIRSFPEHQWVQEAKNNYNKLKDLKE